MSSCSHKSTLCLMMSPLMSSIFHFPFLELASLRKVPLRLASSMHLNPLTVVQHAPVSIPSPSTPSFSPASASSPTPLPSIRPHSTSKTNSLHSSPNSPHSSPTSPHSSPKPSPSPPPPPPPLPRSKSSSSYHSMQTRSKSGIFKPKI